MKAIVNKAMVKRKQWRQCFQWTSCL